MQTANRRRGMCFHLGDYTRATGHPEVVHITVRRLLVEIFSAGTRSHGQKLPRWPFPPLGPKRSASGVAGLRFGEWPAKLKPWSKTVHRNCQNFYASFRVGAVLPLEARLVGDERAYSAHECHFHIPCIMWRGERPDVRANLRIMLCSTLHIMCNNR
jgi:hypothetical protein